MSEAYNRYLYQHRLFIHEGFNWIRLNAPQLLRDLDPDDMLDKIMNHDQSKDMSDEYPAYDAYFYGGNRSKKVVDDFRLAWLHHIHENPHHWQHWVLINDDAQEGTIALEMPYRYILEMICDWWSFSLAKGKKDELFAWYEEQKERILLHSKTRKIVEESLAILKNAIQQQKEKNGDGGE